MKGFVLAAGFGTRLAPLTQVVPKPLFPVGNLPLIGYALRLLAHHGITDVIVNLHHLGRQVRDALGDGAAFGVQITYSEEREILGTGGGLKKQHAALDETFVVVNSDTIIDVDLAAVLEQHRDTSALATMVLRADAEAQAYGQIELDADKRIRRILGHGSVDAPLTPYMFTGVHVLEPRLLEYVPPDVSTCIIRYGYMKALANDEPLCGYVMDGYWADAGTPRRYYAANLDALEARLAVRHVDPLGGPHPADRAAARDRIYRGYDVEIGEDVELVPPVLLGDGARIKDGARVGPHVVVGPRVQIGRGARVSEAILLEGTRVSAEDQLCRVIVGRKHSVMVDGDAKDD